MSDPWLRTYHPAPDARTRLVCFPHAGGAASYWFPLSAALAPATETLSVQYPGRQDRRSEPLVTDLHRLADGVARALRAQLDDRPWAFFGHSYGAVVAYETARRLAAEGTGVPDILFVSGRRAPSTHRDERLHLASDARLVEELRLLDGSGAQALADPEILAMTLPVLRADYRAVETYVPRPGPPLDVPVTAMLGDADPKATVEEAAAWRDHTTAGFDLRVFDGGHFYLADRPVEVTALLRERLTAVAAGPQALPPSATGK